MTATLPTFSESFYMLNVLVHGLVMHVCLIVVASAAFPQFVLDRLVRDSTPSNKAACFQILSGVFSPF
jgi:hypothetical protein